MTTTTNRNFMRGFGMRVAAATLLLSVSSVAMAVAQTTTAPAQKKQAAQPQQAATTPTAAPQEKKSAPVAAAPAASRGDGGDVVARAGDNDLTAEEVRNFVGGLPPADQAALARDPALFSQTLRLMLANQLVLKEALAKKWDQDPTVAEQLQRVRDNAVVESYLQSIAAPPADFPSESDLEKAYEANKAAFLVPRQFQVAQIYVSLPAGSDKDVEDKAKKKLADLQAKLKDPSADFAAIAKADSDERASGERGGEIGWLGEEQMKPEVRAQVIALTKGATSGAVQVADGWHILKLLDTKPAATRTLAEIKEPLAQRLRAQRAEANRRAQLARLLEQSPPTINELALSKVLEQPKGEAQAK